MLKLPNVTMVVVETRAHELLRIAALDALSKIDPAEVIIHTDDPKKIAIPGARYIRVTDWESMLLVWEYTVFEAFKTTRTSHALFLEWDAGVANVGSWRDQFLDYDYIGAPWWWTDGQNVGNGGFCLRSKRLTDHLQRDRQSWTDNMICRDNRPRYEREGNFKWAPDDVAHAFAHEHPPGGIKQFNSFGFHDSRNWDGTLDRDEIIRRVRIMVQNLGNGPHYNLETLLHQMPWLRSEVAIPGDCNSWKLPE